METVKSIIQINTRRCYLCERTGTQLDCHHIFGGKNRKMSELYGLKVYLCHDECHLYGQYAVHKDKETDRLLKRIGQREGMQYHGWTEQDFIRIFGKNYLTEDG